MDIEEKNVAVPLLKNNNFPVHYCTLHSIYQLQKQT